MTPLILSAEDVRDSRHNVLPARVLLGAISVLTQVRVTMEVGDDLVPSIRAHGQQTPGVAVALTPEEARQYIEEMNDLWGSRHTIDDFSRVSLDGVPYYFILVAGHRRYRACQAILAEAAEEETAFDGLYRVDIRFGMTVRETIPLQFNENRHQQVPPHEEARAAWKFYRWLLQSEPGLTIAGFARRIGRTSEWVRGALRFCTLPVSVQNHADGTGGCVKLPYGILVNVARLGEEMSELTGEAFPERAYHEWILRAILDRLDVKTFGKMVSEYLSSKRQEHRGQLSLFGLIDDGIDERPIRRVVAEKMIPAVWMILNYLRSLERVRSQGGFGDESHFSPENDRSVRSAYSLGSPIRITVDILEYLEELVPHLEELAKREGGRNRARLRQGATNLPATTECFRNLSLLEEDAVS